MRTKFFAIAALVLGLASCQKDFAPEANLGGEIDFQLAVSAPELSKTRAGVDGAVDTNNAMDSAFGAIDYLDGAFDGVNHDRVDWTDVDIRYSLEVYDAGALDAEPIKDRIVIIKDKYEPVTFDLRLIPNRNYRFVVFADFVDQGASKDADQTDLGLRHTINGTLQNIAIKEDKLNDEAADAYFKSWDFTPTSNTHNRTEATLTRPYAKLRVVATDLAELNLNLDPASVEVRYTATHPATFNAVTGTIEEVTEVESVYDVDYAEGVSKLDLSNHTYTANYDDKEKYYAENAMGERRHSHMTLFTDYILATGTQQAVSFKMTVKDGNGETIKMTDFNTTIPIQRNHLTTIIGNVLTSGVDVEITINDNFASEAQTDASLERRLLETLINGGKFVLTEDLTLTAPHFLQGIVDENGVVCRADAVIDLNGYTLKYVIPSDVTEDVANKYAIFVRVLENASLTFVGEGQVISDGYIASVNDGGVLNVSEGTFKTNSCTVFQSNGGEINIAGGVFEAEAYNGDHRYTINFVDSMKQEGLIEITGGSFYKYNPSESNSENPAMDFCGAGYWGVQDGDWYEVVAKKDVDLFVDHAEVYTAEGLLKWAYIVNNGATAELQALEGFEIQKFNKNNYGLRLMANITMPMYTVEADDVNETYTITSTPITIDADGKPSGSNWVVVAPYVSPLQPYCDTFVDGNNKSIKNLTMYSSAIIAGFLGYCENVEVKNLTFERATIYSTKDYVAPLAYMLDGSYIHGVNVNNSYIRGTSYVAGIAAEAMDHYDDPDKDYVEDFINGVRLKLMPLVTVSGCTTDVNTTIVGAGSYVGGIVAQGYGCMVIDCHNQADISGNGHVGGVAGYFRDYFDGQYGYIVNCTSTACTITSTGARVGGIVGYLLQGHDGPAWIVGCYSNSAISCTKNHVGSIVGHTSVTNKIVGNYAISTRPVSGYGDAGNTSFSFASEADITAEKIAKMNEGIAEYNAFAATYKFPDVPVSYMPMTLPTAVQW